MEVEGEVAIEIHQLQLPLYETLIDKIILAPAAERLISTGTILTNATSIQQLTKEAMTTPITIEKAEVEINDSTTTTMLIQRSRHLKPHEVAATNQIAMPPKDQGRPFVTTSQGHGQPPHLEVAAIIKTKATAAALVPVTTRTLTTSTSAREEEVEVEVIITIISRPTPTTEVAVYSSVMGTRAASTTEDHTNRNTPK